MVCYGLQSSACLSYPHRLVLLWDSSSWSLSNPIKVFLLSFEFWRWCRETNSPSLPQTTRKCCWERGRVSTVVLLKPFETWSDQFLVLYNLFRSLKPKIIRRSISTFNLFRWSIQPSPFSLPRRYCWGSWFCGVNSGAFGWTALMFWWVPWFNETWFMKIHEDSRAKIGKLQHGSVCEEERLFLLFFQRIPRCHTWFILIPL